MFHRYPTIGDTLFTRTEVVGLKQNSRKPGRASSGLAALRMTTIDQAGRLVLDFHRCAMLPLSPGAADTGHADDLTGLGAGPAPAVEGAGHWNAEAFRRRVPGPHFYPDIAGSVLRSSADVVSSAPELARLTSASPPPITMRAIPAGGWSTAGTPSAWRWPRQRGCCPTWRRCWDGSPVTTPRRSTRGHALQRPAGRGRHGIARRPGRVLSLRSVVYAAGADGPDREVLDWRFTALHF